MDKSELCRKLANYNLNHKLFDKRISKLGYKSDQTCFCPIFEATFYTVPRKVLKFNTELGVLYCLGLIIGLFFFLLSVLSVNLAEIH